MGDVYDYIEKIIPTAAADVHAIYHRWTTEAEVAREMWWYAGGRGHQLLTRHAGDTDRLTAALRDAGREYGEQAKAYHSGYSVDDVAWYTTAGLARLISSALNPHFDGQAADGDGEGRGAGLANERGNLLASVVDARVALEGEGFDEGSYDRSAEGSEGRLQRLVDKLGGDRPSAHLG